MTVGRESWIGPSVGPLRRLLRHCAEVVEKCDDPKQAAKLLFLTGRIYEELVSDHDGAQELYLEAFGRDPNFSPNLEAARRLMVRRGDWRAVLDLIDAELRSLDDPEQQAESYIARGKILEQELQNPEGAREAYACAVEFDEENPEAWRLFARSLHQSGSWMELDDLLSRVTVRARDPRLQAALLVRRGSIQTAWFEDHDEAIEIYEESLNLQGGMAPAFQGLKRLFEANGYWEDLIELLQQELKLLEGASKLNAYHELARLNTRRLGRTDRAIELLERAERIEPDDILTLTELDRLYEQTAQYHDQIRVLSRLAGIVHNNEQKLALYLRIGAIFENQLDDHDAALESYRSAVGLDPGFVPAAKALGRLCRKLERWELLLETYKSEAMTATEEERQALAHYRAGELLENQLDRIDDAIEQYSEAVRWVPAYLPASRALCRLCRQSERWEELVALYEAEAESLQGHSLGGENPDGLRLARLEQAARFLEDKIGDVDGAIDVYKRILETDPTCASAILALERIHESNGSWAELKELLEREVELVDDECWDAALLHQIGEIAQKNMEDQDLALVYFQRALTIKPDYVPSLTALGRIFDGQGKYEELIEMHRREVEVLENPRDQAATLFQIGEIYRQKLQQAQHAEMCYRDALELEPSFWPAWHALERQQSTNRDWVGLAELMEQRASQQTSPEEKAIAYFEVGQLLEERLSLQAQAADAYKAASKALPSFLPAARALSHLLEKNESWHRLAGLLDEGDTDIDDGLAYLEQQFDLFDIYRRHLDSPEKATEVAFSILDADPENILALMFLAELYREQERWDGLAQTCRNMALATDDPILAVGALRELASILRDKLDKSHEAEEVHRKILELRPDDLSARRALGVHDEAWKEQRTLPAIVAAATELLRQVPDRKEGLPRLLEEVHDLYIQEKDWLGLNAILGELRDVLRELDAPKEDFGAIDMALARLDGARLDRPDAAEARLLGLLGSKPDDLDTRTALAELLSQNKKRQDDAIEQYRRVLDVDPTIASALRGLHVLWGGAKKTDAEHCALGALRALALATDEEKETFVSSWGLPENGRQQLLTHATLISRINNGLPFPQEASALLQLLGPHLTQLFPPDSSADGLSNEESNAELEDHPLLERAEQVASLLGVPDYVLRIHDSAGHFEGVEPTIPPSVLIPRAVLSWPEADQLFVLARTMARLPLGTWVGLARPAGELEILLAAATRIHITGFAIEAASDDTLDDLAERLATELPRDVVEGFESRALAYARAPSPDFGRWFMAMDRAASRAGLLVCGDLHAAICSLRRRDDASANLEAESSEQRTEFLRARDDLRALLRWHLSDDHLLLRRMARLDIR